MTTITAPEANNQDFISQLQEQTIALTRSFIQMCQTVYAAKLTSDRQARKLLKESLGWASTTANPYIKIGEWIADIEPSNLELLDINTIKSLCCEKYRPILERLKSERLTVAEVREEMSTINKGLQKPKQPAKALEWKQTREGDRFLNIRLEDPETSMEFESQLQKSQQPLLLFVRSLLRQASQSDAWQQAQQELNAYIQQQQPSVSEAGQNAHRLLELNAQLEKVRQAIAHFVEAGYDQDSLPLMNAKQQEKAILRELNHLPVAA